ncbi:MAG: class I SAM-dependent methyltransferase, partial [Lachnospiraceae bacterium]|nr:class I SAM-dependent methyltransferase [Lachnospiraceae bacterium]
MSEQIKKQNTIDYYNKNAASFAQSTASVDFHEVQDKFLTYMPEGAKILDFGCGAGRDAKYFAEKGFEVVAVDGSEELCKVARSLSGITVRQMFFADLDETESYDGIWACASILHLPMAELRAVFRKMINAIKPGGYIYTSFKYGTTEGYRGERYFIDFTEKTFESFRSQFPEITPKEQWVSKDVRPGRENEKWLNAIMKKSHALAAKPVIARKFTFEHYLVKVIEISYCNHMEINYQLAIVKPLLEEVFPEYQIPDTSNNSEGKKSHCRYYYTLENQSAPDLLIAKNYVYENLRKKPQVFAAVEVKQQC